MPIRADRLPSAMDGSLDGADIEVEVGPVAHGGHCVGRAPDGRVVFVRHTLPGERVIARVTEERPDFLRADAVTVLEPSADRVTPPCPWAGPDRCGGCDFQHVNLPAQRALKAAVVREQLIRLGGLTEAEVDALAIEVRPLPDVAGEPAGLGWRSRVQYTVDSTGRAGLLKHRSHEVVPIEECLTAHPGVRAAAVPQQTWPTEDGVEVIASTTGDVTVVARRERARVVVGGPTEVHERAVGREWTLPSESFWQIHPAAADTLAQCVLDLLAPREAERAWDLYGGAGLFAAALAPRLGGTGRITLVESDAAAINAAERNLKDLTTVTVVRSDVERALANPRWRSVDLVVVDPPRAGAGRAIVEAIIARNPRAVAYVACDPAAFGRDVRTLRNAGWKLRTLRAFDLFPNTHHVECVGLLTR